MSSDQARPEGNLKKQLISLGIIVILIIGGWVLSAVISEAIFQRGRYDSVDELDKTKPVDVDLDGIAPPNFTPPEDWSGLNPDLLNLLAGLPFLAGALGFDNIDQLNTVVFRIYPEGSTNIQDSDLWRYSAYDEYRSNGWARSDQAVLPLSEVGSGDPNYHYLIRVPFGDAQQTSLALPTTHPYPNIQAGSILAEDSSLTNQLNSYDLNIDSENGATIIFDLFSSTAGNLTYGLYRDPSVPPESYYNNFYNTSNVPQIIKNKYLQFPNNDRLGYFNSHPSFQFHVNNISTLLIGIYDTYTRADIIRDYIVNNFILDLSFPLERPGSSDDIVEWFLERGGGLPMDFAAAFVMICRWFSIPCRYTMGYNSRYGSNVNDPAYGNRVCREIQLSNMDAWNEIYFPTDGFGSGEFAPFILSPSLTLPSPPDDPGSAVLNILINGTYTSMMQGLRGFTAHLDFELGEVQGGTNDSQELSLYDHTEEVPLGSVWTDGNGYANYDVVMDNSFTAGAHFISVQHSIFQQNACAVVLAEPVNILLSPPNPTTINRSITNDTSVTAFIYDPVNNNRVKNAILHPRIVQGFAAIPGSVIPSDVKVDGTGSINRFVTISEYVSQGIYKFRVDFNGTYEIINPVTGFPQSITIPVNDASSNTFPFQIIDDNQKVFDLYIDTTVLQEDTFYRDRDTDTLTFDVYLEQALTPVVGGVVEIRDRTYGNVVIDTITTGAGGLGSSSYALSSDYSHWIAGVHELYGYWQSVGRINQSFYLIIDETINIEITTHVTPSTINRTGGGQTTFTIAGRLYDPILGANVRYGIMGIAMMQGITDYTSSLTGSPIYFNVGNTGTFSRTYGVVSTTPIGTYQIYIGFDGNWLLEDSRDQLISHASFTPLSAGPDSLTVNDPTDIMIEMWIDFTPTQNLYPGSSAPQYSRNDVVRIDVRLWEGIAIKPFTTVYFRDETRDRALGNINTNATGGASFFITLNSNFVAGLNMISVSYSTVKNYTQIHLDAPMYVHIVTIPGASSTRGTGQVTISGEVRDQLNDYVVKGSNVQLYVRDFGGVDRTDDITTWLLGTPGKFVTSSQTTGLFTYAWRMPSSFHKVYRITVYFNGNQADNSLECPANYYDAGLVDLSAEYLHTVYAGVSLSAFYSPQTFVAGQPVYIDGRLTYDNGTAIVGVQVTIRFYDSGDNLLHSNTAITNGIGDYSYSTTVLWSIDSIYVEFARDDTNYIAGAEVQAIYL